MVKNNIIDILYMKYDKLVLNKEELSSELGISQATLNRQIKNGTLPISYTRIGIKYMFTIKSLAEHIEDLDELF